MNHHDFYEWLVVTAYNDLRNFIHRIFIYCVVDLTFLSMYFGVKNYLIVISTNRAALKMGSGILEIKF